MDDPLGRVAQLAVFQMHQAGCVFGPQGMFFRLNFVTQSGPQQRYFQTLEDVQRAIPLLASIAYGPFHVQRDACLDGPLDQGDANTPDVVDAEQWLAMPRREGMAALGLTDERAYARAYDMVEAAVYRRANRESQTGVHASIVIKKKGARVIDAASSD